MISKIHIDNVATYTNPIDISPYKINFIYGGNGTGKTTLSRMLNGDAVGDYVVEWTNGTPLKVLVFNRDFVEGNISTAINGIFTLGKDDSSTLQKLESCREQSRGLGAEIDSFKRSFANLEQQEQDAANAFAESCWVLKQRYGNTFKRSLQGSMGGKKQFMEACLNNRHTLGAGERADADSLRVEYETVYSDDLREYSILEAIDFASLPEIERCELLEKRIIGSADSAIGTFIDFLNNSNWVKEGLGYANKAEGHCPFCQREMDDSLRSDIESYFDAQYLNDCSSLDDFRKNYSQYFQTAIDKLQRAIDSTPEQFDSGQLAAVVDELKIAVKENLLLLASKINDPSKPVSIQSVSQIAMRANSLITSINEAIEANNQLARDAEDSKKACNTKVWKAILYDLRGAYDEYSRKTGGFQKGRAQIQEKIDIKTREKEQVDSEIAALESTRTSITPTVNAINGLLSRFGYKGFLLSEDAEHEGFYKIVRPNGDDAKKTLSEGEYNFISFLYFYHLVYGSLEREGVDTPRVVVIDDPISSLDSNIMFIVTTLAKEIARDCWKGRHDIAQVFISTHNVYFHKEVTFLGGRECWPETQCCYWVINKVDEVSAIETVLKNPISTAYELLWEEIRDIGNAPNKNLFNTMRRILEYYFNVVGGLDYERCVNSFPEEDRVICKSLISCINEESHLIVDDFVMCFSTESLESYRRIFEQIFINLGHEAHFNMMMERGASLPAQA